MLGVGRGPTIITRHNRPGYYFLLGTDHYYVCVWIELGNAHHSPAKHHWTSRKSTSITFVVGS